MFVLYNYYREPWLIAKLDAMLRDAFGQHAAPADLRRGHRQRRSSPPARASPRSTAGRRPATRSTPIPVGGVRRRSPPPTTGRSCTCGPRSSRRYYLAALALVLLCAALVVLAWRGAGRRHPVRRFSPHFFVLGIAFLLLETRSLVSFSLLFGSTWLVNALAFFAILASVLLAIVINARLPLSRPRLLYAGAVRGARRSPSLLPPESLLIDPPGLRYLARRDRSRSRRSSSRTSSSAYSFRDTQDRRHGVRQQPARRDGRRGARVPRAAHRLPALLVVVARSTCSRGVLASRFRLLADRDLVTGSGTPAAQPASSAPAAGSAGG